MVDPGAYDRYMGRYSLLLAPQLADFAKLSAGQRVLDVGCGPGALTAELVKRLGAAAVSAADPSEPFVAAVGFVHNDEGSRSMLRNLTIEEYRAERLSRAG